MKGSLTVGNLWKGEKGEGFLEVGREKVDAEKVGVSGLAADTVQYTQTYMALCG